MIVPMRAAFGLPSFFNDFYMGATPDSFYPVDIPQFLKRSGLYRGVGPCGAALPLRSYPLSHQGAIEPDQMTGVRR